MIKAGTFVLVRTYSAGVHFGNLISMQGQEVHLANARRLWSWQGALSLSEIAVKGIKIDGSKISVPVDEIILTQATEVIIVHKNSNLPGNNEVRKNIPVEA